MSYLVRAFERFTAGLRPNTLTVSIAFVAGEAIYALTGAPTWLMALLATGYGVFLAGKAGLLP